MRANFASLTIAALSFLSLAACSDRPSDPVAPRTVDTLPRYYMCPVGALKCSPPPPRVTIRAIDLSAGSGVTCAVDVSQYAFCWGDNTHGMLGTDNMVTAEKCTDAANNWHYCSTAPIRVVFRHFAAISVGGQHVCGIEAYSGNAYCWGENGFGQLGVPVTSTVPPPPPVPGPTLVQPPAGSTTRLSFISIAAGGMSTCGVTTAQQLYCWGAGYGSVPILTQNNVASVSQNSSWACALTTDQHTCAGWRGNATSPGPYTFISQGSAATHFCQIFGDRGDGFENTECWGDNNFGQLGNGKTGTRVYSNAPVVVPNMFFQAVAVGNGHTCAIQSLTGNAYCWGDNEWLQFGNGNTYWGATTPQPVTQVGVTYVRIAAGDGHTCAADPTGAVWCWGLNTMGQLGIGSSNLWLQSQPWPRSFAGVGKPTPVVMSVN